MLQRRIKAYLAAIALLGVAPATPAGGQASQDASLLGAALVYLSRDAQSMRFVIEATPLALQRPDDAAWSWVGQSRDALRISVEAADDSTSSAFPSRSLPPNTSLLTKDEAQQLHGALSRVDSKEAWETFCRRYQARALYAFSVPVITGDGLQAFLVYSRTCGVQCQETGFMWLTRDARESAWTVEKQLPTTIA